MQRRHPSSPRPACTDAAAESVACVPRRPGTYALFIELPRQQRIAVGRLGPLDLSAGIYLYAGSALGPGGLAARLGHHVTPAARPHWHIDHLRAVGVLRGIWYTADPRRLECAWSLAARALRGACCIAGFGASDCACPAHLVRLARIPTRRAFRRGLVHFEPPCAPIRVLQVNGAPRGCSGRHGTDSSTPGG
jgi:Uri superfamily endonuclease